MSCHSQTSLLGLSLSWPVFTDVDFNMCHYLSTIPALFVLLAMAIYTGVTVNFLGKRFGDWRFSWSYILGWVALLMTFFAGLFKLRSAVVFIVKCSILLIVNKLSCKVITNTMLSHLHFNDNLFRRFPSTVSAINYEFTQSLKSYTQENA